MDLNCVKEYQESPILRQPYLLFLGSEHYLSAVGDLKTHGWTFLLVSEFCGGEDKLPNLDLLFNTIQQPDEAEGQVKMVVLGLGEFLALRGHQVATEVLGQIKDLTIDDNKVVFLLRGLTPLISTLTADLRFDNRRYHVIDEGIFDLSLTLVPSSLGISTTKGFQSILGSVEEGFDGRMLITTEVPLTDAMFTVAKIETAYEGIVHIIPQFPLPYSCGTSNQWLRLLEELQGKREALNSLWEQYSLDPGIVSELYSRMKGDEFSRWVTFIYLKCNPSILQNSYLSFVLEYTDSAHDLISNLLDGLISFPHTDPRFSKFYLERKSLIEKIPESDVAEFVLNNRVDYIHSIYRLTDTTRVEREEVLSWIADQNVF